MGIGKEMFDAHCALKKVDNDRFKAMMTALLEELKSKKDAIDKEREAAHEEFLKRIRVEVDAMDERERQEYLDCMKEQAVGKLIEELIEKIGPKLMEGNMNVKIIRLDGDDEDDDERHH